jgi:hypothetical protein
MGSTYAMAKVVGAGNERKDDVPLSISLFLSLSISLYLSLSLSLFLSLSLSLSLPKIKIRIDGGTTHKNPPI